MHKPRHGVFFLIFGADIQHNADILLPLQIFLKLRIHLPHGGFLPNLQIFRAVIAHNATPERIIQVQNQRLFVFPVDRLYDIGNIEAQYRNRRQAERILVHMPVKRIRPSVQSIAGRKIRDIIDIKMIVFSCILIKSFIQPV